MELDDFEPVGFGTEIEDMIHKISSYESPLRPCPPRSRRRFVKHRGGSMRARRRRKAKPLIFTSAKPRIVVLRWSEL